MEEQRRDRLNHGKASHRLQVRQLGRHRDRLLLRHYQPCFNHHGRSHHGDSYFYFIAADSNTNRNGNTYSDGDGYSNRDIYTYAWTNGYSNGYRYCDVYADPDCNGYFNPHGDSNSNRDIYTYARTNGYSNSHSYGYRYAHGYFNANLSSSELYQLDADHHTRQWTGDSLSVEHQR
jgi:hypothetical protein